MRLELHTLREGHKKNGNDPVLVFINGLFADLTSFDSACLYVRDHYEIFRYDCRGQGQSPKPEMIYTLNDHVEDLLNLIKKNDLKNIVLIGLSNGGRIALEFARRYSNYLKAVVACDTYDIPSPMMKAKLSSWLKAYECGGGLHRFDVATPWIWGEETFNAKSELLLSYREKADSIAPHVVKGLILGAMEDSIDLSKIEIPLLFVVGKEDLLTPVFIHEAMVKKTKSGELKIAPGGHASLIEKPMIMEQMILPWIKALG